MAMKLSFSYLETLVLCGIKGLRENIKLLEFCSIHPICLSVCLYVYLYVCACVKLLELVLLHPSIQCVCVCVRVFLCFLFLSFLFLFNDLLWAPKNVFNGILQTPKESSALQGSASQAPGKCQLYTPPQFTLDVKSGL